MRRYGWIPDVPDHRDRYFSLEVAPPELPRSVERIGMDNPIENQGDLGSCSGVSATSALEITLKSQQLSKLMAYYDGRVLDGLEQLDSGASIRSVIKGLAKWGVCGEMIWPYDVTKFAEKPSSEAYRDGQKIIPLVSSYKRVSTLGQVKSALSVGLPVVFGFSVPDYFESEKVAETGWVRTPTFADGMYGGHAVVAVGYESDSNNKYAELPFVWARNSWGTDWGYEGSGYFMMDEAWFWSSDHRRLVDDMWVIYPDSKSHSK